MKYIDYFLDRITMYRLVLYLLIFYLVLALIFSVFNILPFSPVALIGSILFLVLMSWSANTFIAHILKVPTNLESVYITALILALIISPVKGVDGFIFLGWAAILAMASKYALNINKKHIFNPAAFSVVVTVYVLGQGASWWVGTAAMMPAVLGGGLLLVRKLRQEYVAWVFFVVSVTLSVILSMGNGSILTTLQQSIFHSSLLFFGFIMLTEPLTMPPSKLLRIIYSGLAAILFTPQFHFFSIYFTPELALITVNVFSYLVSPKGKLLLTLREKTQISWDVVDFVFDKPKNFSYIPGQYMEWTLSHPSPDSRGTRRYLTLASSPTEDILRLGVKFYDKGSSFKRNLDNFQKGSKILAGQLSGEFTLPKDEKEKLVFVAGGIGITPYRSMIKYLLDTKQKRDIVIVYSNKQQKEIVYQDIFTQAEKQLGIKTIYTLTDKDNIPNGWKGNVGRVDENLIRSEIPDYKQRKFYLSGPQVMVDAYRQILGNMGVTKIKTDFFPGLV